MSAYWPWWASALALSAIAVGYVHLLGRTMGVSGSVARTLRYRQELAAERTERGFESDAELVIALAQATRDAFGELAPALDATSVPAPAGALAPARRLPIAGEVMFLAMMIGGAFVAATLRGAFAVRLDMGEEFARLVGTGARGLGALFVGGLLVGLGTRLAGGCTSGHGLAGCARLERGSLIATACFFGTAILVSRAMEMSP
jgi:uncharacterized membrane protein YedE/YeeE